MATSTSSSYDNHIKSLIEKSAGNVDKAAIFDLETKKKLNTDKNTTDLAITDKELHTILQALREGNFDSIQKEGFTVAGVQYKLLSGEAGLALGRSEEQGAVSIQTTQNVMVLATTSDGMSLAKCDMAVGDVKSDIRAEERKAASVTSDNESSEQTDQSKEKTTATKSKDRE